MKNKTKLYIPLILLITMICYTQSFAQFDQNERCELLIKTIQNGMNEQSMTLLNRIDANCEALGDGTPLIAAARSGNLTMVAILIQKFDADVNREIIGDGNALIQASRSGHLDIVAYLIQKGANVNAVAQEDQTPLINAAANGHLKIIKLLISKGADINKSAWNNSPKGRELRTPLSIATRNNQTKVMDFLLSQGAI